MFETGKRDTVSLTKAPSPLKELRLRQHYGHVDDVAAMGCHPRMFFF
jgi:hypothetical protein